MMFQVLAFVLGGWMAIQAYAAAFLVVDLGYARRRYWRRILGPICGWWLSLLVVYGLLPSECQHAYIYAGISVVALHVVNFLVARWLLGLAFRD